MRYDDDLIVGFDYRDDAERFWTALGERFQQCHLERLAEKTPQIEFGRYAAERRQWCVVDHRHLATWPPSVGRTLVFLGG